MRSTAREDGVADVLVHQLGSGSKNGFLVAFWKTIRFPFPLT